MVAPYLQVSDPRVAINIKDEDEALAPLAYLESPTVPTFYECGIIETSVGYYQLGQLENGRRVLIFAFNMEDLQLKEYPVYGKLFAHPGIFYGVNAYEKSASPTEIYNDLINHQLGLLQVVREEYTLARTEKDVYQSRAVSYALTQKPVPANRTLIETRHEIAIDAFIHSLHGKEYAPVFKTHAESIYDRMRVSRIPLETGPIDSKDAVYYILDHYADQLNKLTEGKEGIQDEDSRLSRWSRARLRMKMYGVRFLDNITKAVKKTWKEMKEKKPEVYFDLITRLTALAKLPELLLIQLPALVIKDVFLELPMSLWDAFNMSSFKEESAKVPELLKPYLNKSKFNTRLASYLYHLDSTSTETMRPLDAEQSNIAPVNTSIVPGDPFEVAKDRVPDIGALRAPLGTIVHKYGETTLVMQANGVWIATNHVKKRTYVGYNKKMDTNTKPTPLPILKAWLGNEQVICYTHENHGHKAVKVEWKEAALDLQEIIVSGDAHLIAAQAPTHDHGPHVLPMHGPVDMRYLDFPAVLNGQEQQKAIAVTATAAASSRLITMPIEHHKRKRRGHNPVHNHTFAPGNVA